MKKQIWTASACLLLMVGLLCLYMKIYSSSEDDHWTFTTLLADVRQSNFELNEALIKSSLMISQDYDSLVEHTKELTRYSSELLEKSKDYSQLLQDQTSDLQSQIRDKISLVESFKSKNAITRNSSTYFMSLVSDLVEASISDEPRAQLETLRLAWQAQFFINKQSVTQKEAFEALLARALENPSLKATTKEKLRALQLHKTLIEKNRSGSSEAIKEILNGRIETATEKVTLTYQEELKKIKQQNRSHQLISLLISLILFSYTLYIAVKFWKLMGHLEDRVAVRTKELEESHRIIQTQQENLTQSSKMSALGEMAGGIAHEINNPLAIITMSCRSLRKAIAKDKLTPEFLDETMGSIEVTTIRISKIVKGLKTFSRGDLGHEMTETTLKQIMEDTLTLCQERFKNDGIELSQNLKNELLPIYCNPTTVSQVLLNLLGNSCDAIAGLSEKWIRIESSLCADSLRITVTDSGTGIHESVVEKIMQPFFTTKEIGKGTGLGLSISKGIVESHGGTLEYDKTSVHTRFVISLPVQSLNHPRQTA